MAGVPEPFDADRYWSKRLTEQWNLQGVGHQEYSERYNRWLYRRKHAVLRRALRGAQLGRALDLGSGTGWVVSELRGAGFRQVDGCELTEVAVTRLRDSLPGAVFHHVDIAADPLPVPDGAIDVVTMLDVAYHVVDDSGLRHVVTEVARVLRPGGLAVVTDSFDGDTRVSGDHVIFRGLSQWRDVLDGSPLAIEATLPYFRMLSRPRESTWRHWWHPAIRGPIEWAADTVLPLRPWLRLALIRRGSDRPPPGQTTP